MNLIKLFLLSLFKLILYEFNSNYYYYYVIFFII